MATSKADGKGAAAKPKPAANKKKKKLTKMQQRDVRDWLSLAITSLGWGTSVIPLLLLSPRKDPEGRRLATDLKAYFDSLDITEYTVSDYHTMIGTQAGMGNVMCALSVAGTDRESSDLISRLRIRMIDLKKAGRGS